MSEFQFWLAIVQVVVTASVAVLVPVVTFKFSRRLKEMEERDRERGREFELTKLVSNKALEALADSYHQLQRIFFVTDIYRRSEPERKQELVNEFLEAQSLLVRHQFYLPDDIRKRVSGLLLLSVEAMQSDSDDDATLERAFDEIGQMCRGITDSFSPFMRRYNLLNRESCDN